MRPLRRAQDFEGRELQALQQLKVRQMGDSIDAVAEDCIARLARLYRLNDKSVLLVAKLINNAFLFENPPCNKIPKSLIS